MLGDLINFNFMFYSLMGMGSSPSDHLIGQKFKYFGVQYDMFGEVISTTSEVVP